MKVNNLTKILSTIALALTLFVTAPGTARAQEFALKSNIISDALLSPNIGAELQVAPKWSVDLSGQVNFWKLSHSRRWKHWLVQPEARYWFCQALGGHFVGAHLLGGEYNFGALSLPDHFMGSQFKDLKNNRYQGWYAGIGVAYGYAWMLGKHWNIEAEIGAGYVFSRYDKFECVECGRKVESNKNFNYVGITKAALNLVYIF